MIGAEPHGDVEALFVFIGAGDDDQRRAGLLARDHLAETLLARTLDQNAAVIADRVLPNSFTMTVKRCPESCDKRRFSRVVFPAPRKPVTTVTGTRVSGLAIWPATIYFHGISET